MVNALSVNLTAEVNRDGWIYTQEYSKGLPVGDMIKGKKTKRHGTTISFYPDPGIFPIIEYDFELLAAHFKEIGYLNKGLEICFQSNGHILYPTITSNACLAN